MFEIEGHKSTIIGLGIGGVSGFLLHKNLKVSKGVGILIGSVLGIIIGFQITKSQAKKLRDEAERLRNIQAIDQKNKMVSEGKMTQSGEKILKNGLPNKPTEIQPLQGQIMCIKAPC